MTIQEETKTLQKESSELQDKYFILVATQKEHNLKFRGFGEGVEGTEDLACFMGNWLVQILKVEGKDSSIITKVYRLGPNKPNRSFPCDILIILADLWVKHKLQNMTQEKNGLVFLDKKIQVYSDIPSKALTIQRNLKPIVLCLQETKIQHR